MRSLHPDKMIEVAQAAKRQSEGGIVFGAGNNVYMYNDDDVDYSNYSKIQVLQPFWIMVRDKVF